MPVGRLSTSTAPEVKAEMGEAKRHRKRFFEAHPRCCFCGGGTPATTIDHIPSAQTFRSKQRPSGLEFPACGPCNSETRNDEQGVALIARCSLDSDSSVDIREADNVMHGVHNNIPGLLEELTSPSARQRRRVAKLESERTGANVRPLDAPVFNVGPIADRIVKRFATKLALGIHYIETGDIIPPSGGVVVFWRSNYDAMTGNLPNQATELLGPFKTLQQGRKEVSEQFGYGFGAAEGNQMSLMSAYFRQAFMLVAFVRTDRSKFTEIDGMRIHTPFRC